MTIYEKRSDGAREKEIYDFTKASWYVECKKQRKTIFTDIYLDAFGKGLTITCAEPYYDGKGNFLGVFALDILISDVYEEITNMDMGEGAYAFLLDEDGYVISPDGEHVPVAKAEALDEEASEILLASNGSVFERHGIYYTGDKITNAGWILCIHAPADLTLSTVRAIDNDIIAAIIAFILIFAVRQVFYFYHMN